MKAAMVLPQDVGEVTAYLAAWAKGAHMEGTIS